MMAYKNNEGYSDPTAGKALKKANKPPENIVMFRKMMKAMCAIFRVRVLGKVTLVDEKGNRW